jgi:hypothetical protein
MSGGDVVPYVAQVLDEQDAYRAAAPAVLPRAVRSVAVPLAGVSQMLISPEVIEAAIKAADWVAEASIRNAVLDHDFAVLEACDTAAGEVRRWSLGYAVTGGGAAGALGLAGLAIDVPATMTLALRTARLTGLAYGFGSKGPAEQIYILNILQLAGANSAEERQAAMARLAEGRRAFSREDWRKVSEMTGQAVGASTAARRVAETLGVNLSMRKMAQVVPLVGAAVGASVNAAFQNDVAAAARFAFRARWLEINEGIIEASNT